MSTRANPRPAPIRLSLAPPAVRLRAVVGDFISLTRPRIIVLLLITVRALRGQSARGAARLFHYCLVYLAEVFAVGAPAALAG